MDKKIRLLQVIPRLDVGGAETGCKDIGQYIANQNYFSAILCSGGEQVKNIDQTKRIYRWLLLQISGTDYVLSIMENYG